MAKTRSQEDTKGKGDEPEDSTEQRLSRLEARMDVVVVDIHKTLDQRFAELRDLLGLRIDCDEEQLPVMDDETDLLVTRTMVDPKVEIHKSLVHKANLEEESLPQFQLRDHQKSTSQVSHVNGNGENVAHQVFGKMSQHETLGIKKKAKGFKSWRFKFKQRKQQRDQLRSANQLSIAWPMLEDDCFLEDDQVSHETLPLWLLIRSKFRKSKFRKFKFGNKNFQKRMREHGHFSHLKLKSDMGEDDEMFTGDKAVSMRFLLGNMLGITESDAIQRQQAVCEKVVMMNEWLQPSLVIEQVMRDKKIKFTKQWMFKFKVDSKLARINHILHQEKKPTPELAEEKESKLQVLDLHQTFLCHQIGCGIDILLVVKMLDHDKGMAVVLQRSTSLTTRDCPDRSSRANRVWKPGLEIYGCVIKKQMLLNDKLANHVWHRWKNKAGKLKASLVCSGKRWSFVVYAFYDHTVVLRKEPILSPKIKRGFELSYLPNLEVKVSLKGEDLIQGIGGS